MITPNLTHKFYVFGCYYFIIIIIITSPTSFMFLVVVIIMFLVLNIFGWVCVIK